jgi:large repetitive protein
LAANLTKVNHADLIPTLISAPTTGNSGTNVTLRWSVRNQGTTATSNSWSDRVYLSDNATFEADKDRLFGDFAHTDELAVGANKQVELNTKLPVDLSGDKYILIVSDGTNQIKEAAGESNNLLTSPINIALSPYADLAVSNVTAPSLTIADPARVKVNWTVTNQGNGTGFTDSWKDRVIVSGDQILGNGDDRVIGEYSHTGDLGVNESYTRSENILLPPAFTGRYNLYVQTDATKAVFENGLESNNTVRKSEFFDVMTQPYADLGVTKGNKVDLTWKVANQGVGKAEGSWKDQLYLQEVGKPNSQLINLASYTYEGKLDPGKSYIRQEKITIPSHLQGIYQVVVQTKTVNSVYEGSNSNNNQTVDNQTIQISLPPRPDLQVQSITAPNKVNAGGTVAVEFDIINQRTAATNIPNWTT